MLATRKSISSTTSHCHHDYMYLCTYMYTCTMTCLTCVTICTVMCYNMYMCTLNYVTIVILMHVQSVLCNVSVVSEGVVEVWLTSEDTGAYGRDIGTTLPELLKELVCVVPEDCMLRIGMTNPPYILEHLQVGRGTLTWILDTAATCR